MASVWSQRGLGLRAVLCCVFDKDEGPVVVCSDPPTASGLLLKVKALGKYLLPESFVKDRVVSVVLDDHLVIGAPVYINDTQYDRNCFQFNICMVISSHVDTAAHRDLAQHLALSFRLLEVDLKFLSQPESATPVQPVLAMLRKQLNQAEECFVKINGSYCICFRIRSQHLKLPPPIEWDEVPLPLVDLSGLLEGKPPFQPDLALLEVVPFIDGVSTVRAIVDSSGLDKETVVLCLRHLLHFGFIAVIDDIRRENCYCVTPTFHDAFDGSDVRAEVVRYVTAGRCQGDDVTVEAMVALYAVIDGWTNNLGEFQEAHAKELRRLDISLRHFITYGVLRGFLERIGNMERNLSHMEQVELKTLRTKIAMKKQELKDAGCQSVNKDAEVMSMVRRMNELKDKEKHGKSDVNPSNFLKIDSQETISAQHPDAL